MPLSLMGIGFLKTQGQGVETYFMGSKACPLNPELFYDKNVEHVLYSCLNGTSLHLCLVVKKNRHLVQISTSIIRKALYCFKKNSSYLKAPSHTKDAFINGRKPAPFE
jgi:hypothetical protein